MITKFHYKESVRDTIFKEVAHEENNTGETVEKVAISVVDFARLKRETGVFSHLTSVHLPVHEEVSDFTPCRFIEVVSNGR